MNRNKIAVAILSFIALSGLWSGAHAQSGIMVLPEAPVAPVGARAVHATPAVVPAAQPMPTPSRPVVHLGRVTHVQYAPSTVLNRAGTSMTDAHPVLAPFHAPEAMSMGGFVVRAASAPVVNGSSPYVGQTPAPSPTPRPTPAPHVAVSNAAN
jgi:hypothetical protein